MSMWLRRVRGAIGMGLTWAVGWAVGGVMIGVSSLLLPGLPWDSFFEVFDAPLPALAMPGFVAGALFSIVLGIAGRRRRFDELSLPRFAAWGALGGLLLSLVPAAMVGVGLLTGDGEGGVRLLQITAVISGPFVLLSAVSASVSLLLARRARGRVLLDGDSVAEGGLVQGNVQARVGSGDRPLHAEPSGHGQHVRPDLRSGPGDA